MPTSSNQTQGTPGPAGGVRGRGWDHIGVGVGRMGDESEEPLASAVSGPSGARTGPLWRAAVTRTPSFAGSHLQRSLRSFSSMNRIPDDALGEGVGQQDGVGGAGEGQDAGEGEGDAREEDDEEDGEKVNFQDWQNYYDHEVMLDGSEFLRSFVWELVGPLLNLPLIMLLAGGKWRHVATNRAFWPGELTPIFIFSSIAQICRVVAIYLVASERVHPDDFEWRLYLFILACNVVRAMIVAFKYAYMCKRDIADNYKKAPKWSADRTNMALIAAGWMDPRAWGMILMTRACQESMVLEDVDLTGVRVTCTHATAIVEARKHLYRNALVQKKLPWPEEAAGGPSSSSAGIVDTTEDGADGSIPAYALLEHIVYTYIGDSNTPDSPNGRLTVYIIFFCLVVLPLIVPVTRAFYGLPAYGTGDPATEFVYAQLHLDTTFSMVFVLGMPWNMAHDYARRANALEALGLMGDVGISSADLFKFHPPEMSPAEEGVPDPRDVNPSNKVFPDGERGKDGDEAEERHKGQVRAEDSEEKKGAGPPVEGRPILECLGLSGDEIIKINLRESSANAFGWMLIRRVLYSLGERFKRRFQAMSLIMYSFSLTLVVILCVLFYTRTSHRIEFLNLCVVVVMVVNVPICVTILAAMRLSELTVKHRGIIMKDQFSLECENAAMESELSALTAYVEEQRDVGTPVDGAVRSKLRDLQGKSVQARAAGSVLGVAGELLSFHEEHCSPTTVLGVHANSPFAVVAALSTLGAGIALLLQSGTDNLAAGYGYNESGVYSPDVGQLY